MSEFDFDFLQNIGRTIYEILSSDNTMVDWLTEVVNYYSNHDSEYPEGTIDKIIKYFSDNKTENQSKILDDIKQIILDPDNVENFLGCIFFPSEGEEEEKEEEEIDDNIFFKEEEPKVIEESALNPDEYFDFNINKTSSLLQISYDIAYLLLNKFSWDKSEINKFWLTDQENILKSLRINLGTDMVPDLQSPLSLKPAGNGECPICFVNTELYQLYCGHKLCKECLIDDIKQQIHDNSPPLCRQTCENGDLCNAEIMPIDIKNLLDEEFLKIYTITHRNYLIMRNREVKSCPNPYCDWIITPANSLLRHVGRCYRCNAVTCLIGNHESHAPLMKCELMDHFLVIVAEEMNQLESDQKKWFLREERLRDYRRGHIKEVQNVFNDEIQKLMKKQNDETSKEEKRINELNKEVSIYLDQLSDLRRRLNQLIYQSKSSSETEKLKSQIDDLTSLYNKKSELKHLFELDLKIHKEERNKNLETAKIELSFFMNALNSSQYQFYMSKFKESQEVRAYKDISITSNDDDYIKRITRECPKCHYLIQRDEGCNYMECKVCKFAFCWLCGEAWIPTHRDHFECPKIKNIGNASNSKKSSCGINFDDLNDKKFYPQPMSIDKRAVFIRYNNLNNKFRENKDIYNKLFEELMDDENKGDLKKDFESIPDYNLCPRTRLERALNQDFNVEDSKINAMRIINTMLFAQSVVMWSYPTLYYMAQNPHKAQVFEYKVSELSKSIDRMKQNIRDASQFRGTELMRSLDSLKNEIDIIIDDAVIF